MIRRYRKALSGVELVDGADSWALCTEPERMLPLLVQFPGSRKARLLACAYIRHAPFEQDGRPLWDLLPEYRWFELEESFQNPVMTEKRDLTIEGKTLTCRSVIEIAESRADGLVGDEHWETAKFAATLAEWNAEPDTWDEDREEYVGSGLRYVAANLVGHALTDDRESDRNRLIKSLLFWPICLPGWRSGPKPGAIHAGNGEGLCHLIRDLYGNPFRPVHVRPEWVGDSARELARTIYDDRAFQLMPVLGDALEEGGCSEREILLHCREGGLHARGCHVIDEVLGREWLPPFDPGQVLGWLELCPERWD